MHRPGGPIRMKEKYVILFGVAFFMCICYSTFQLLPNNEGRPRIDLNVRAQIEEVLNRPEQLVLPRPPWRPNVSVNHHRHGDYENDVHMQKDRDALQEKIDADQVQIPLPIDSNRQQDNERNKFEAEQQQSRQGAPAAESSPENEKRRLFIIDMMKHAWDGYEKYAWGANEVRPVSKSAHTAAIFGRGDLGATIIDGMDTLFIMGLMDRYEKAKKWVEMSFDFHNLKGDVSVFETNIRFVGGLLSMYALTNDTIYKTKCKEIVDLLMPAFNTPTGIPYGLVDIHSKSGKNWGWASGGSSILSEFGSLHLEFEYLSDITGDKIYYDKAMAIRNFLDKIDKPDDLYPNYLNPKTGKWGMQHVAIGALADSFYEYLIKSYVATGHRDVQAKRMYDKTIEAMERTMKTTSQSGFVYFADLKQGRKEFKFEHLGCFCGGMFALQSLHEDDATRREHFLDLGKEIGRTCHESYIRTSTGLGPESFRFTTDAEAITKSQRDKYYILRPEVIETWFYLWRTTKDQMYRDWAWNAAQAIETHCRSEAGYSGIRDVYQVPASQDDVQQSFFLAETLKYLYLIFSDDTLLPLDKWVFNTEAHPLPLRVHDPKSHD